MTRHDPRQRPERGGNFSEAGPPDPLRHILSAALRLDERVEHFRDAAEALRAEKLQLEIERSELVQRVLEAEERIAAVARYIARGAIDDSDFLALQRLRSYADTLEEAYRSRLERGPEA